MALAPGTRLGPYEVTVQIGAGGMGEVYRATDTKLKRQVAIKVLPPSLAADQDRLARFQREAEVLASLNHPNIAHIHGLEESGGIIALVMELVEGEDLSERIARGALSLPDAIRIAKQISRALEAAHAHGIIHRDLKPANIKVRPDGTVKLLDFGLAKASATSGSDLTQSPTITSPAHMTGVGVILGTAAYMPPEQARGRPVDKRADVWAFGALLYEMLTRRRCFVGANVTETFAAILREEPNWSLLPPETPAALRRLLRRSLTKDLDSRLSDMAMVRVELHDAEAELADGATSPPSSVATSSPFKRFLTYAAILVIAVAAGMAVWMARRQRETARPIVRFALDLPDGADLQSSLVNQLAISPDGSRLAYVAGQRLYIRSIDQLDAIAIAGRSTRTADRDVRGPFFSADGRSIAFWENGQLKRVTIDGGAEATICDVPASPTGAMWGADDQIVFGRGAAGIMRVSAKGGNPVQVITVNQGERADSPQQLPGTEWVLFMLHPAGVAAEQGQVVAQKPGAAERRVLIDGAKDARYVSSGHLVFGQGDALMAQVFDPKSLELRGEPVRVLDQVSSSLTQTPTMYFAVSSTGTILYLPGGALGPRAFSRLVQVARDGNRSALIDVPGMAWMPRYSPEGKRVAYGLSASTDLGDASDLWVLDIERASPTRVTFQGNTRFFPIWTPDGKRLTFSDGAGPTNRLQTALADGSNGIRSLTDVDTRKFATSWSPDGRELAFHFGGNGTGSTRNIGILHVDGEKTKSTPFVQTPFEERGPIFSPNGRWIAYVSLKSGQDDVYATPYPGPGSTVTISAGGGQEPVWSPSGHEMFYRHDGKVFAVALDQDAPNLAVRTATRLFDDPYRLDTTGSLGGVANYDISRDALRFVMVEDRGPDAKDAAQGVRLQVILNWTEELKRLVPTR